MERRHLTPKILLAGRAEKSLLSPKDDLEGGTKNSEGAAKSHEELFLGN